MTPNLDEQILGAWDDVLGSPVTRTIDKMDHGRVWSVTTDHGHSFVLKQLADTDLDERRRRFTAETRIVTHLAERGLPVAVPVLSDDGRICTEHDGALWALTPMLPAPTDRSLPTIDTLFRSVDYYRDVGRAIATMHTALADCPYDIDSPTVDANFFVQAWDRLRAGLPVATFEALRRRVEHRRDRIARALTHPDPQRLHGDCHGGNILVRDGRVTGIVDIDHLQIGPRTFDLAYHLAFQVYWVVRTDAPGAPAEAGVASATRHLLDGYQSVSPLSEPEHTALAPTALAVALNLVAWFLGNEFEVGLWVRTACWIADHEAALQREPAPHGIRHGR